MIVPVQSTRSLVHLGSLDSFDITKGGKDAARLLLEGIETGSDMPLRRAVDIYEEIIPHENFGGEYTALQWLCRLRLAPKEARREFLRHPEVKSWVELLARDGCARLKWYLERKYHFVQIMPGDAQARRELRFLEDFILFGNPDRERWEQSAKGFRMLDVRPGETVADIGAGSGYYAFRFADRVGPDGRVYAVETNPMHLEYLRAYVSAQGLSQVTVVPGGTEGIGLPPGVTVDTVFLCSLYHVFYAALTLAQRDAILADIRRALRPGGRLVIVDNDLVEAQGELPYHGPYIARDLVAAQLAAYGFALEASWRFTPQRYALVFRWAGAKGGGKLPGAGQALEDGEPIHGQDGKPAGETGECLPLPADPYSIDIRDRASLACYRMAEAAPTAGYSPAGREAAARFLAALEGDDRAALRRSLAEYRALAPRERIGDEYTAFAWVCRLRLAQEAQRRRMLADDLARMYFETLGGDELAILRAYLRAKYDLPGAPVLPNLTAISEYIAFNNPARDDWEHTDRMLADLHIGGGMRVADIGCGSGFFSYRFARAVGSGGRVYATETNPDALRYVKDMRDRLRLPIETIVASLDDTRLPAAQIDLAFLCSMVHAVYITSIEFVKDAFMDSLRRAMAPGGRLVVVDNDVPRPGIASYYGSSIDRRLLIAQLARYGFRLVSMRQYIPQRYVLEFA